MTLPQRFKVGAKGLAELSGWKVRGEAATLLVTPVETYEDRLPDLVKSELIADREDRPRAAFVLHARELLSYGGATVDLGDIPIPGDLLSPTNRAEWWASYRFEVMTASDNDVLSVLWKRFVAIRGQFADASLWMIYGSPQVSLRAAAVRALYAASEFPETLGAEGEDFEGFPLSHGLMSSLFAGLGVYVGPLVMTLSPWLIGMPSARSRGSTVLLFGRSEPGFINSQAAELLDLLRPNWNQGSALSTARPNVSPGTARATLEWWSRALNALLGVLLDPTRYRTAQGDYIPRQHAAAILSVERLFSSLGELLANPRTPSCACRSSSRSWTNSREWASMIRNGCSPHQ